MSIIGWLLIGLGIVVVVVVILIATGTYKPYKPPTVNPTTMSNLYTPTNPWNWDAKHSAVPVDGPDGVCSVYTFASFNAFAPAIVGFTQINGCGTGCTGQNQCVCSPPLAGQICVDDDQLFAQKLQHICQPTNTGWDVRTSGQCRQQNGELVDPGTVEQFYAPCNPTNSNNTGTQQTAINNNLSRCPGTIGLIVFGANIRQPGPTALNEAQCMQEPDYIIEGSEVTGTTPVMGNVCDMRLSYNGYPRELFRVQRADFNGTNFVPSQAGPYAQIIHRPTGYGVAPTLGNDAFGNPDLLKPILNAPLQLLPLATGGSKGYWWLLMPQISDPSYTPPLPNDISALNGTWNTPAGVITLLDGTSVPSGFTYTATGLGNYLLVDATNPRFTLRASLSRDQNVLTLETGVEWTRATPVPATQVHLIARPQLVYVPDPTKVPSINNPTAIWSYLTSGSVQSVTPISRTVPDQLVTTAYITTDVNATPVNGNPDPQEASKLAAVQYLDYALVGLMTSNLSNFDFNGPFPTTPLGAPLPLETS